MIYKYNKNINMLKFMLIKKTRKYIFVSIFIQIKGWEERPYHKISMSYEKPLLKIDLQLKVYVI